MRRDVDLANLGFVLIPEMATARLLAPRDDTLLVIARAAIAQRGNPVAHENYAGSRPFFRNTLRAGSERRNFTKSCAASRSFDCRNAVAP